SLGGTCEVLEAAEGDENQRPRFLLMAYTGVPGRVEGFFSPVLVELAGATFAKKVLPVISDHDPRLRIGHTLEQFILPAGGAGQIAAKSTKGPLVAAVGVQSSNMAVAAGFVADSREGFPFEVSIGARIVQGRYIEEGEKVEANGKTFKGPLILAEKTVIRELSILTLGADSKTSAVLVASEKK